MIKNLPATAGDAGSIPRLGSSPEEGMAAHSSILACEISSTEEPGRLHLVQEVQKSRTSFRN